MSHVATVILLAPIDSHRAVAKLNDWLFATYGTRKGLHSLDESFGGNKAPQADTFGGAFSVFDVDAFLAQVWAQEWEAPESIQVLILDEHDDTFTLHGWPHA